jgi:tetratricopeptide (TPR) repeat protein
MRTRRGGPAPAAPSATPGPDAGAAVAPPPAGPGSGRARRERRLVLALLALATFAAFAPVLRNDFVLFDDPEYVTTQARVLRGLRLDDAFWFLTHPHTANWHPLTTWSHMLDVQLFGTSPGGHHATSLLLHVVNALLLALVLFRLTGAWWRSVAVAALFALHPLRVESVAWVSERKDVLSGLFFLLTIEAYRRWVERPGHVRYALLLLALALGLMSKPMLVTLPFVLVLLDLWPLGRLRPGRGGRGGATFAGLLAEKWPLFALAAASAVVTFVVQRRAGAVIAVEAVSPALRVTNAALSYWRYVGDTLWPRDLAVFHPFHAVPAGVAAASLAGLVVATAGALALARRRPYATTGWLWYAGMLVPVVGLVQVGSQAYADRYTYLPTIGVVIALVWLAGDLVARSRAARAVAVAALLVALAALSVATWRQAARWKDTTTLFTHTLAVTHDNPVAHQCLGSALLGEGKVEEAMVELREALRLAPRYPDAHNNLGQALGMLGRHEEALGHFRAALQATDKADVHHNVGFALDQLGRKDEAMVEYEAALRRDPQRYLTLVLLANDLAARGRFAEAEARLARALALNPDEVEPHRLMAVVLTAQGRVEEAIREYGAILERAPDDLDALNNVAWIRATHADAAHRDGAEAMRLAERAVAKSPEPAAVLHSTLAAACAEAGRFADAVREGERAVALARSAGAHEEAARYAEQLRRYRAGQPFHFAP